jgi:probable HAF family extracellular repeat protein
MLQRNTFWKDRFALVAAGLMLLSATAFAGSYRVQELGLAEGASVTPHALNNKGAVAGGVGEAHGGNIAMFTFGTHGATPAPSVLRRAASSEYAEAMGMNDSGTVVGAMNGETALAGFVWDASAGMRRLAPLAGDNGSTAAAINAAGEIAGSSMGAGGIRAVVWKPGSTTATQLATFPGAESSQALAIDANGNVAGWAAAGNVKHAVLWTAAGEVRDMGALAPNANAEAGAINANGQVAGIAERDGASRAFVWTASRGMLDLGVLSGGTHSEAFGINGGGAVVGSSGSSLGLRAFMWNGSGMTDLNTLIPNNSNIVLTVAVAINDQGQILALGSRNHDLATDKNAKMDMHTHAGATRAFLLTPQ